MCKSDLYKKWRRKTDYEKEASATDAGVARNNKRSTDRRLICRLSGWGSSYRAVYRANRGRGYSYSFAIRGVL